MTSKWCVMQEWGCLVDHSSSPFRRVIGERPQKKAFSACSFRNTGLSPSRSLHGPSTQIKQLLLPKPGCIIITPKRIATTNFYNLCRYTYLWPVSASADTPWLMFKKWLYTPNNYQNKFANIDPIDHRDNFIVLKLITSKREHKIKKKYWL